MGLFQSLEDAAGVGGGQSQPAAPPGVLAAIIQMVQSQPGGIGGVIQQFQGAGLEGVVQSWLGAGANQPVSANQVQTALGPQPVSQVASQLGVSPGEAAGHIAQFLPLVLDHLSPNGQPPPGAGTNELQGLLSRFSL